MTRLLLAGIVAVAFGAGAASLQILFASGSA